MWARRLRLIAYKAMTYDSERLRRLPTPDSPTLLTPRLPRLPRLPDSQTPQTPPRPLFPFNRGGRLVRHIVQERTDTRDF